MFVLGAALTLLTAYAIGVVLFRKIPLPAVILFALGAAVESLLVYFLFAFGIGSVLPVLAAIPFLFFLRPAKFSESIVQPLDRATRWIVFPILAVFAVYYLVHALAPEIQPDAISYHLGLVAEYLRLHAFPHRVGFYEVLPQGLEMLFAVGYSIGGAPAAKLVHFAFLLATLPLIVLTARRLQLSGAQGYTAAALYFAAPVAGISGTSAYNDAALVFFTLATFYLFLLWRDTGLIAYALAAGLTAGFCYAIKLTGLLVPALAVLFMFFIRREARSPSFLSLGALMMIAPWMLRALVLTHNPFAPLLNAWFPNPYFNPVTERALALSLSSYPGFHWPSALWDWAIAGPSQGVAGPLILAAPLALLAWRKPAGRLLLAAAILLLLPVLLNVGTRFLMPALPFLALALAIAIPRSVFLGLAIVQAAICFPPVILTLEQPHPWALHGFPWRAALRLEPEQEYLQSNCSAYAVARFVQEHATSHDRIFAMDGIATAYTSREVVEYWHSNRSLRLTMSLQNALAQPKTVEAQAEWPAAPLTGIRFTATADSPRAWTVFEARFYSPGGFIYASPQWKLAASDNLSDAPAAFDGNRATSWTTRVPQHRGMFLEAEFDQPLLLNSVMLTLGAQPEFMIEGRTASSPQWRPLSAPLSGNVTKAKDLRRESVHALQLAGYTMIGASLNGQGLGAVAVDMVEHPTKWGVKDLASYGQFHLMRIMP